jgi:hypothetical protein
MQAANRALLLVYSCFLGCTILRPQRWSQYFPLKYWLTFTIWHGDISQKTELLIVTAVRTSNPTLQVFSSNFHMLGHMVFTHLQVTLKLSISRCLDNNPLAHCKRILSIQDITLETNTTHIHWIGFKPAVTKLWQSNVTQHFLKISIKKKVCIQST